MSSHGYAYALPIPRHGVCKDSPGCASLVPKLACVHNGWIVEDSVERV